MCRHDQDRQTPAGTAQALETVFPPFPQCPSLPDHRSCSSYSSCARSLLPVLPRLAFPNRASGPPWPVTLAVSSPIDHDRPCVPNATVCVLSPRHLFPSSFPSFISSFASFSSCSQHTSLSHPYNIAPLRPLLSRAASFCHLSFVPSFWLLAFGF